MILNTINYLAGIPEFQIGLAITAIAVMYFVFGREERSNR